MYKIFCVSALFKSFHIVNFAHNAIAFHLHKFGAYSWLTIPISTAVCMALLSSVGSYTFYVLGGLSYFLPQSKVLQILIEALPFVLN